MFTVQQIKHMINTDSLHTFYNSRSWRRLSHEVMRTQHNECQMCKAQGKYSKAVKFTTYVVPKVKKISVKNNKKGTITITASKVKGAAGYAFVVTADSNLYDIVDIKESKKNTVTVKNLTKGHTYYIRACAYKLNKQKQKVFGVYAKKAKITIKK